MPPVRTTSTHKLAQRTERSHEENQERAYIAASRRSDRSLEARVESARRASEIHKKRTGRALRVREEDVLNEEMYEEEDDELSQQMRRMNALHPGFTSFSDRLNSYMAGHLGIRSALQQAIMQANQYNAQQLINPMMQTNGMMSPQSAPGQYSNNVPQSPWSFAHLQGSRPNAHNRSASIATPQELSHYQQSPLHMNGRRPSLPGNSVPPHGLQSPSLSHPGSANSSHPSTPHGLYTSQPNKSPLQVPTPPLSNQTISPSMKDSPNPPSAQLSHSQSPRSQIAPLTTKLPVETQQLFDGSQQAFNQTYFPSQMPSGYDHSPRGSYSYHPNSKSKLHMDGLNQTLAPANLNPKHATSFAESYADACASADRNAGLSHDPFHDLGIVSGSDLNFGFDHNEFGTGSDMGSYHSDGITPGLNGEPAWNPDDFLNFGASE